MAIKTTFNGIEYRSRLEAKWGAFFWRLGWHFTYEPFDGDGYIPDFVLHGDRPLLVEVKPAVTPSEYQAPADKITRGVAATWKSDILVVGIDPLPPLLVSEFWNHPAAGLLGQSLENFDGESLGDWSFAAGLWVTCNACKQPAIFHPELDFTATPCGHHDGDAHLSPANLIGIRNAWEAATNDVKWRGRAA